MSESIFISYRRDDSAGFARALHTAVCQRFDKRYVFMDVDAIEPGLDFVEAIEQAVGACSVLLAVIGAKWLTRDEATGRRRLDNPNDYVRVEIAVALRRNIRVIPVLLEDTKMPSAEELPDELQPLTRRNALNLSNKRFEEDMERLFKVLGKYIALRPSRVNPVKTSNFGGKLPPSEPAPPKPRGKHKRRWFSTLLSLTAFGAAGMGAGALTHELVKSDEMAWSAVFAVWVIGFLLSIRVWRGKRPAP